jgi:predicted acylesterase/phospholipase RssA
MKKKKALLLGAGGPLGGLEAGALIALDEMGVKFDIISGACIGSVLTLTYASPANGMTGREALEMWCNASGLSDLIYHSICQSNYKVFQKNGRMFNPVSDAWLEYMTRINPFYTINPANEFQRFANDMYLFWLTAMTPGFMAPDQPSISRIAPFLESFIDFDNLKNLDRDIYINAMNVTDKKIDIFDKEQITMQHLIAGSSLFFICPQQKIGDKWYGEGSYIDSLNYKGLMESRRLATNSKEDDIETLVVMNILNKEAVIRTPNSLYDAYNLSIMLPFITIAEDDTKLYELKHKGKKNLLKVGFKIPEEHAPYVMDWSASNFKILRDIGYEAGVEFYKKNKELLI